MCVESVFENSPVTDSSQVSDVHPGNAPITNPATMLDPIADMLTRIRNAQRAGHRSVSVTASKLKRAIADILVTEGFLEAVNTETAENGQTLLSIALKYETVSPTKRLPAIQSLERVSKEGCRVYVKRGETGKVKNGFGLAILSTSQGVMTGKEAAKRGLGGEFVCKVW